MNYADIRPIDVANGPGVRVSLFVSGCPHRCPGCFNPETWDFQYGQGFGEEQVRSILDLLRPGYIRGLTLLGGEPWPRRISRRCSPWYAGAAGAPRQGYLVLHRLPLRGAGRRPGGGRWTGNFFMSWMCWWTAPSFWSRKTSASVSVAVPTSVSWMFPVPGGRGGPLVGQPPGLNPAAALSFQGCRSCFYPAGRTFPLPFSGFLC